jgi:hypothetical protein
MPAFSLPSSRTLLEKVLFDTGVKLILIDSSVNFTIFDRTALYYRSQYFPWTGPLYLRTTCPVLKVLGLASRIDENEMKRYAIQGHHP